MRKQIINFLGSEKGIALQLKIATVIEDAKTALREALPKSKEQKFAEELVVAFGERDTLDIQTLTNETVVFVIDGEYHHFQHQNLDFNYVQYYYANLLAELDLARETQQKENEEELKNFFKPMFDKMKENGETCYCQERKPKNSVSNEHEAEKEREARESLPTTLIDTLSALENVIKDINKKRNK